MIDLAEFLLARIAEDEAVARSATAGPWSVSSEGDIPAGCDPRLSIVSESASVVDAAGEYCADFWLAAERADLDHIARHDPARVIAECNVKRRMVEMVRWFGYDPDSSPQRRDRHRADVLLCALAVPYASHADYAAEWAE